MKGDWITEHVKELEQFTITPIQNGAKIMGDDITKIMEDFTKLLSAIHSNITKKSPAKKPVKNS